MQQKAHQRRKARGDMSCQPLRNTEGRRFPPKGCHKQKKPDRSSPITALSRKLHWAQERPLRRPRSNTAATKLLTRRRSRRKGHANEKQSATGRSRRTHGDANSVASEGRSAEAKQARGGGTFRAAGRGSRTDGKGSVEVAMKCVERGGAATMLGAVNSAPLFPLRYEVAAIRDYGKQVFADCRQDGGAWMTGANTARTMRFQESASPSLVSVTFLPSDLLHKNHGQAGATCNVEATVSRLRFHVPKLRLGETHVPEMICDPDTKKRFRL